MMLIASFVLLICFAGYATLGYPLLMRWLSGRQPAPIAQPSDSAQPPSVCAVIVVFNGEQYVERRINNLLEQTYPQEQLQVVIVDDGSTDETVSIIAKYPQVQLLQAQHQGKSAGLGLALQRVDSDVVVFADVRQTFAPDAIERMVGRLSDASVGAVGGNLVIEAEGVDVQSSYWNIEKSLRGAESDYRSMVGVSGAIYAAKRSLLPDVPSGIILDDVLIPMHIVRSGHRVVFETQALAYDSASATMQQEFKRKVRTSAGNLQLIRHAPWLLSPRQNPIWFEFVSHKLARLLLPWCLLAALILSFLARDYPAMQWLFWAQLLGYAGMACVYGLARVGVKLPLSGALNTISVMISASFWGAVQVLMGRTDRVWR